MNEIVMNNAGNPAVINFSSNLFNSFVEYLDVKDSTLKGYVTYTRQFLKWLQAEGISQPQREDVKAYKAYLEGQNFTAGTKAQYLRAVKYFFKWTAAEGFYPNIADNIKTAKTRQDNTKKEAFAEEDVQIILDSIDRSTEAGKRDYAMILLSVTGGLRIIEMQRANIQDMQTLKGQRVLYIQGKGHDSKDDYVKLIPEVAAAIDDYLQSRPPCKKNAPLFTGTSNRNRGGRLTVPTISRMIKAVFQAAGYDSSKLTAHSLRHTSNTMLFKAGADLYTVQKHARHCDPRTTEVYLHILDKETSRNEQKIYNQIFNLKQDAATEACEIIQKLPADAQQAVLDYVKELLKDSEAKIN